MYIPDPIFRCPDLSTGEKLCYARLLRYCGAQDTAHPKIRTLSAELNIKARQVRNLLKGLEKKGFIRRVAPPNQKAVRLPNDFHFLYHKVYVEANESDYRTQKRPWDI